MVIVEEQRDIAPTVVDVLAAVEREVELPHARAFGGAVLAGDGPAVHVVAQHRVDHARNRVRAIDGGGAVAQDLKTLQTRNRDRVGVVGQHRNQVFIRLRRRVADDAAAVQQHQRIADAQIAQVDRAGVAARRVGGRRQIAGVEGHVAHLRDGAQQLIARSRAGGQDLFFADDRDRQGRRDLGAANLRPDDDDLIDLADRARVRFLSHGDA